jgi:hypothetical protein
MINPHSSQFNWDLLPKLLERLTFWAAKWFLEESLLGHDNVLPATGISPRDFAFDTVINFIEGGMTFRPKSPETYEKDLLNFLKKVMRNDFLDLIKSHEYDRTDVIDAVKAVGDDQPGLVLEDLPDPSSEDGFYSLEAAALYRKVFPLVKNDPELKEFVEAVLCFGCWKRDDIAKLLDVSLQEVTYRKNRLRLRLASWYRSVQASRKWALNHEKDGQQLSAGEE